MYYLMNKDIPVLLFESSIDLGEALFEVVQTLNANLCPIGFEDINVWIEGRKASKHNAHLELIMKQLGCDNDEGFIKVTHAASINDTFWIKSDMESAQWADISLYRNQFTEVISKLAFEGLGLYDIVFSSTSPELTCEGAFRKCFTKEKTTGERGSDIFLYKRGSEENGLELYCEVMAAEIAKHISSDAIYYELANLHGKPASKCNLFTSEKYGYAPYARLRKIKTNNLRSALNYFVSIGSEQLFREMLVIDSLCFNQDRHAGNYGVLFDTDTLSVLRMAPIFDLNLTLLPYATMEDFEHIGDTLFTYSPRLGSDFTQIGQIGINDAIRDRVKDMKDFSFTFQGDDIFPKERVKALETIVRKQAAAILSSDKLYTKDVFFSQAAEDLEKRKQEAKDANKVMSNFVDMVETTLDSMDVLWSTCGSTDTVQLYIEKDPYEVVFDFLTGQILFLKNANPVLEEDLRKGNSTLWENMEVIKETLKCYANGVPTKFVF